MGEEFEKGNDEACRSNVPKVLGQTEGEEMSWEEVYREKLARVQMLCEEAVDKLNTLSEPADMAGVAIEAINQIQTIVSPD